MPKTKESAKKAQHPLQTRPSPKSESLMFVPGDAVEGFQERIETGIEWTLLEEAARRHKNICIESPFPSVTFEQALKLKLNESFLSAFLDEKSTISLLDNWETILPLKLWDQQKFATEEENVCFRWKNLITDNLEKLIAKAVRLGDRNVLRKDLKNVSILRLNGTNITELDQTLKEFRKLVNLVLCGNYIKDIDGGYLPQNLKMLELQANAISNVESFTKYHARELYYLGLSRNLINDESVEHLRNLPFHLTVLDIGDNDICDLALTLESIVHLRNLISLILAGNPCSVSLAYAVGVLKALPQLEWLDNREVAAIEVPIMIHPKHQKNQQQQYPPSEINPEDYQSGTFFFKVIRVISVPPPPKLDKGVVGYYQIEVELPLLDSKRRNFLMFHENDLLVEDIPEPEDGWFDDPCNETKSGASTDTNITNTSDIYKQVDTMFSRQIYNYTIFKSNEVQWNTILNFQDPVVSIFCPDLVALRNTFRSVITVRLVYSVTSNTKSSKDKSFTNKIPEVRVVLATVKCALDRPDWTRRAQHFHWDCSMNTEYAMHWGDGDLEVLHYISPQGKINKAQKDADSIRKQQLPENLTCHFSFGIDRLT